MQGRRVADPGPLGGRDADGARPAGCRAAGGHFRRALAPLLAGATRELGLDAYSEALYPLHHYGWSDLRALRSGRYKVIDAPRPELYDLERDPQEATNLFEARRQLGDRLIAQLRSLEEASRRRKRRCRPPTWIRKRASGLPRSATSARSSRRPRTRATDRADPKDKIAVFNKLGRATEMTKEPDADGKSQFPQVVTLLEDILRTDPEVIDAWFMLGTQHMTHGQPEKAVAYFQKTLQLKPDYDLAVHQPRAGVPADGQRRCGAGGVRALPDARSERPVRALPDGRNLAGPRRRGEGRRAVPQGAGAGPAGRGGEERARRDGAAARRRRRRPSG